MKRFLFVLGVVVVAAMAYRQYMHPAARRVLLYAYTDNFAGSWSLSLYRDGGFDLTLPAASASGRFSLVGDTVLLRYASPAAGLPTAYLINRPRNKVDELERVAGKWVVAATNNWASIQVDSVAVPNPR